MPNPSEEQFEEAICESLSGPGDDVAAKNDERQGEPRYFDPERGLGQGA